MELIKANTAHGLYCDLLVHRNNIETSALELGRILTEIKDGALFRELDYESFAAFLASPEVSFSEETAYRLMRVHRKFTLGLRADPKLLTEIGYAKLDKIISVVDSAPEEWLYKAKENSKSDLDEEIRMALGKPPKNNEWMAAIRFTPNAYVNMVKMGRCCVCGNEKSDPHHFPQTKKAGGQDAAHHVIPLCRDCHEEAHRGAETFLINYKNNIFKWFYDLLLESK